MRRVTIFDYERDENHISAAYFPENNSFDAGYIKLAKDGSVVNERQTMFWDVPEEYHRVAKKNINETWKIYPLPTQSIEEFS